MRILTVTCAIETLGSLVAGVAFLVMGYRLWRTPVREDLGTALGRSMRDGHDVGVAKFLGLGTMILVYGVYELTSLLKESKMKSQI